MIMYEEQAKVIRRIIAIVLIVLGLGTVGAGIASATIWKPASTVSVPLPEEPDVNYVITEPGVLTHVNPTVKVRLWAEDDAPVFLGIGRSGDVKAWVGPSDHIKITGLRSWDALDYVAVDGEPDDEGDDEGEDEEQEESTDADPATSDIWVEEVEGEGELTYTWEEAPGQWAMIFSTDGSHSAPMVELTWEREVPTPALVPLVVIGALVTIAGVVLLVLALRRSDDGQEQQGEVDADEEAVVDTDEEQDVELTPEEIMASIEADSDHEVSSADGPFAVAEPETAPDYPYYVEDSSVETVAQPDPIESVGQPVPQAASAQTGEDEDRPLTRREIRER